MSKQPSAIAHLQALRNDGIEMLHISRQAQINMKRLIKIFNGQAKSTPEELQRILKINITRNVGCTAGQIQERVADLVRTGMTVYEISMKAKIADSLLRIVQNSKQSLLFDYEILEKLERVNK